MSSGTDKIVETIKSEAQVKADANIQAAQAEVDAILADGKNQAEAEKNKILDNAKKQSDMRYQQIISEAKMNARRAELDAKEEVIEAAFNKAINDLKQIASTDDKQYVDSLTKLIKEAAIDLGGGDLVLHLKEDDINKIKSNLSVISEDIKSLIVESNKDKKSNSMASKVSEDVSLEIGEPIDTIGGAVLKTKNGDIEVDNTIEARLLRYKKDLRSEVASLLFKN